MDYCLFEYALYRRMGTLIIRFAISIDSLIFFQLHPDGNRRTRAVKRRVIVCVLIIRKQTGRRLYKAIYIVCY